MLSILIFVAAVSGFVGSIIGIEGETTLSKKISGGLLFGGIFSLLSVLVIIGAVAYTGWILFVIILALILTLLNR